MSLNVTSPLTYRPISRPAPASTPAARPAASVAPAAAATPAAGAASAPAQAPAESTLWGMLSDDERSFFSQQATLGALTYGRGGASRTATTGAGDAPLGQRLDVRG